MSKLCGPVPKSVIRPVVPGSVSPSLKNTVSLARLPKASTVSFMKTRSTVDVIAGSSIEASTRMSPLSASLVSKKPM